MIECGREIVDPAAIHVFLGPSGQFTQIPFLHHALRHAHVRHPLLSFSYPPRHELEQAVSTHPGGRVVACLQLQVLQPYTSFWYPFGQTFLGKHPLRRQNPLGLHWPTPQPSTTCKTTIIQFINQCLHTVVLVFLALFFFRIWLMKRKLISRIGIGVNPGGWGSRPPYFWLGIVGVLEGLRGS